MTTAGALAVLVSASTVWAQSAPAPTPLKLASTRIVTKNIPGLAAFYEKVTLIAPVGTPTYVEIRTPGSVLAIADEEGSNEPTRVPRSRRQITQQYLSLRWRTLMPNARA